MNKIWNTGIQDSYAWFDTIKKCYASLIDDKSREIFNRRLLVDLAPEGDHIQELIRCSNPEQYEMFYNKICEMKRRNAPIYLYGAGALAKIWLQTLENDQVEITALIDRRYEALREYFGKPVIAPPNTPDDLPSNAIICISTSDYRAEIYKYLQEIGFQDSAIFLLNETAAFEKKQYFEFMEHYSGKGAFIDAGCLNGNTSKLFKKYSRDNYTKIFAFEPDEVNFKKCMACAEIDNIKNMEVIQAGLGKEPGVARFCAAHNGGSAVTDTGDCEIQIVALDDVVKEERVAFIKMDIEGSELAALQGAASTIQRDKPLCAICVYHRPGDILVMMDYLKELVPEYRFAVRHYSVLPGETVLYAFL